MHITSTDYTVAAGGTTSGLKSETRPCSRTHFPPKYTAATNSTAHNIDMTIDLRFIGFNPFGCKPSKFQ